MLKILINAVDNSLRLSNYLTNSISIPLTTSDYIYVGYYKQISDLYIELNQTVPMVDNELEIEYFNGAWVATEIVDSTYGLTQSGYLKLQKKDDAIKTTVSGSDQYWVRIRIKDNNIADIELNGINLVFSDDNDLKEAYNSINEFLIDDLVSFIGYHQEARNFILTYLRNKGKTIKAQQAYKLLDQFDLHNFEEIRQASKYLTLSNIFAEQSDNVDDKWYQKSRDFKIKYNEAINIFRLSIDDNDNGKEEPVEKQAIQYVEILRLWLFPI